MNNIPFSKMSGTMNDFIIIDNRQNVLNVSPEKRPQWVQKICTRKYSIGADGVILIEDSPSADFKWQFYNCDGSRAEMCGNGARCAARFSYLEGISGPHLKFETDAGIIEAHVNEKNVKIKMTEPSQPKLNMELSSEGAKLTLSKINTGVPHAVMEVEKLDDFTLDTLRNLGKTIRNHKHFEPKGTNVTFLEIVDKTHIKVKSYERGVEDITYACGTGVVAAALIANARGFTHSPTDVETPGGHLKVYFERGDKSQFQNVYLEGDARMIYKGVFTDETV